MREENESLHDEIRAAWEEVAKEGDEDKTEKEPVDTDKVPEATKPEPAKDSAEESDKKDEPPAPDAEVEEKKEEQASTEETLLKQDKAPSGWSPKARERWNQIPEDLRSEILRREEDSAKGVRQLQEEVAPMRGFVNTLSPFIQEAFQNAQDPAQYIGSVMVAERALRTGDINSKFEALLSIADQYKIPLREIINKSAGEEVLKAPAQQQFQIPPEIQRELEESRRWREQQSRGTSTNAIQEFAAKNEFFEDVREEMALLLEAGAATDLKTAYEKAIWAKPETREVLLARQAGEKKKTDIKEAQKRASGANVDTDESLGRKAPTKPTGSESVEDDIRASIAALAGRD
jgi:hypothetical protein